MFGRQTVLVVENDAVIRDRTASWLDADGYDVLLCPGPQAPDYTCVGGRGGTCALAAAADVVVLDLALESDAAMTGTPGWEVLLHYVSIGRPVLALVGAADPVRPIADDDVAVLARPVRRRPLLAAVRDLLERRDRPAAGGPSAPAAGGAGA